MAAAAGAKISSTVFAPGNFLIGHVGPTLRPQGEVRTNKDFQLLLSRLRASPLLAAAASFVAVIPLMPPVPPSLASALY